MSKILDISGQEIGEAPKIILPDHLQEEIDRKKELQDIRDGYINFKFRYEFLPLHLERKDKSGLGRFRKYRV